MGRRKRRPTGRVLIIVQNLPVPLDRRVWLESGALRDAGFGVSVICPAGPGDPPFEVLEGIRVLKYPAPPAAGGPLGYAFEFAYCWLRTAALAIGEYRRAGFDVIQACNPPDTYFALAALFRPLGVRFVFDHHDLCPEIYAARFGRRRGALMRVLKMLERATFQLADRVISTNDSYRAVATERGGVAPEKVSIVRSGPDLDRLRRQAPVPDLREGRRFLCCYLGIMGPQDGVDVLVDAARVVVQEMGRTDVQFALLGFGDCLDDLRRRVENFGLGPWVTFTGRAGTETICRYLSTADVGLSPDPRTPFNDASTMNKTLEYMAFGLPVVAFDLRETRVSAGPAAAYVETGDPAAFAKAVVELLDNPERRKLMGGIGRDRIERELGWAHSAPRYVAVYRELLASGRSGVDHADHRRIA